MKKTPLILGLLVVLHIGFAICYASVTPYRSPGQVQHQEQPDYGAPDERQHVNYIEHILDGKGFPVFNPQDVNLYETYQSHQPPLFYILAAGWAKATGIPDVTDMD